MAVYESAQTEAPPTVPGGGQKNHLNGSGVNERLPDDQVLIAGGGPVGLLLSYVLAHYGVRSTVLERNHTTTRWPKMDLTNVRSMELFRRLGLADDLRKLGVPSNVPYTVLISSGLHSPKAITKWEFGSVDDYRARIRRINDGSMPLEPWQRISQAIFEKWLKQKCDEHPLIDCRFGWKVETTVETEKGAVLTAVETQGNGKRINFFSKYVAACDGASSRVRRDMGIPLEGGPVPGYVLLIHFRSKDLENLHKQGRFWHIFTTNEHGLGGATISQNDADIFTVHLMLPLEADHEKIASEDAVYTVLGGMGGPYKIEIDEVIIRSTYRHSIAIARTYRSPKGHCFLVGDSAHQNIPTGGYGMNTGLGDAYDLGWKLATVISKHGGPTLLDSYEQERRPVGLTSIAQSGVHMETHLALSSLLGPTPRIIDEDSIAGHAIRKAIHNHYQENNGENTDLGVEMDHRHQSSVYVKPDESYSSLGLSEPAWSPKRYTPSTWPGCRAPHIFLNDGTPIFDLFGKYYTIVQFSNNVQENNSVECLKSAAEAHSVPLEHVKLIGEDNTQRIWEVPLVIVRPDGHVAWRDTKAIDVEAAGSIIQVIAGWKQSSDRIELDAESTSNLKIFAATTGSESQVSEYKLDKMGVMQE